MKTITKILLSVGLLIVVIGMVYAANPVDIFKAPSSLTPMGDSSFVDQQGHNIQISEDSDSSHKLWFENDTENGYIVSPYEGNNTLYLYSDASEVDPNKAEAVGVLEIVEKDGNKYIISSWSANDNDADFKIVANNLLEFNKLNNLNPLPIEG